MRLEETDETALAHVPFFLILYRRQTVAVWRALRSAGMSPSPPLPRPSRETGLAQRQTGDCGGEGEKRLKFNSPVAPAAAIKKKFSRSPAKAPLLVPNP